MATGWQLVNLVVLAALAFHAAEALPKPLGGYLGCFNLSQLQVDSVKHATFSSTTINQCMPFCSGKQHTMHVISQSYDCWCMTLIPDESARLPAAACSSGGTGVAVFYRFKGASKQMCRLAPVPLVKDSFDIHYNEQHATFTDDNGTPQMILQQQGPDGIRLAINDGMHLYGQFQVTAKIAGASGVVTAFYVRSTDTYTLGNKDSPFHEIDIEFLNGNPAPANSIWLNSYKNGISGGETLVKPADYQKRLGLSSTQTADNTYITYGFNWQPDYVMWSLNGKALQKRMYGQNITWTEMDGTSYWRAYHPPSAASHITFSMWSDGNQTRAFGGKLDLSESPYRSYFTGLKRILCDAPLPSDPAAAAAALGPAWLFGGQETVVSERSASSQRTATATSSSSGVVKLHEVLGSGGRTLTTGAQVSGLVQGAASATAGTLCLERWRGQVSGSSLGFARVAVYPCSSSSTIWMFDQSTGLLRDSSAPGSCLSQVGYDPALAPCSSTPAATVTEAAGAEALPEQQWHLTWDGKLRSASGLCVGVGGPKSRPYLTNVTCGSAQELSWKAGEANLLSYLASAKPLVTSTQEATGFCLHPSSDSHLFVKPCMPADTANPSWQYDSSTHQILLKGSSSSSSISPGLCLSGSQGEGARVVACQAGAAGQQWQLTAARQLRSASGACMGLGAAGEVAAVPCGSGSEAVWSFGGDNAMHGINPGRTLTQANMQSTTPLAVVVETAPTAVTAALALKPVSSSTSSGSRSSSAVTWTFSETYAGSGVGQLAAAATHAAGLHAGMCMTSRNDMQAVQLAECQQKGQPLFKAQLWMWFGGQLKNSGDGKCLAKGDDGHLRPVSCLSVTAANKVIWSFGGAAPSL